MLDCGSFALFSQRFGGNQVNPPTTLLELLKRLTRKSDCESLDASSQKYYRSPKTSTRPVGSDRDVPLTPINQHMSKPCVLKSNFTVKSTTITLLGHVSEFNINIRCSSPYLILEEISTKEKAQEGREG